MATIKYGKGKQLQPTAAQALLTSLVANADTGRVEMADIAGNHQDSRSLTATSLAFAQTGKATPWPTQYKKEATTLNQTDVVNEVNEANALDQKTKQVQVAIHAPDVFRFFSNRTKKLVSY